MAIIFSTGNAPTYWPVGDSYDPNDSKFFRIDYAPSVWAASTPYTQDFDLIQPTVANGCMYVAQNGGISAATEPTWVTSSDYLTYDNTIIWAAYPYTALLRPGDTITTSTWAGDTGAVFDHAAIVGTTATKLRLTAVATGVTSVSLTNTITIGRANGDTEILDRTIIINVTST